jgi:hypothetical protein
MQACSKALRAYTHVRSSGMRTSVDTRGTLLRSPRAEVMPVRDW